MSIFDKFLRYFRNDLSLTDEKAWSPSLWNLVGSQSLSGETVTETTALTYSAVWDAVGQISQTIGALPLHLMRRKGDRKQIADEKPLYRLLHDTPNPYMTAMAFREVGAAHALTWGNWYAEKVRNGLGQVVELWPIPPNRCTPEMSEGKLIYRIRVDSKEIILDRDKILHIPGFGFDGFVGYSAISMARKELGLGMALTTFGSNYFGQGTNPGMVVTHPGVLKEPKKLRDALTAAYSGLGNTHRLMLLEEGMKPEKMGIPPNDSQFIESKQHSIQDVARWFHIPPHKLKDLTKSSFNNIESEQHSYVIDTILPWLVRIEQNFNMQLLTLTEQTRQKLYFKHKIEGLLRGNTESRAKFYTALFNVGAMSPNDIRALEDMDPVEGGDIHLVPLNMQSIKFAGEKPEPKAAPAKAEPKEPDDGEGDQE